MSNFKEILANLHYLNHPLLSSFSALCILSMGIFVILKDKKSEIHKAFFWIALPASIWFFGNALAMFYYKNLELTIFWWKFGYTAVPFMSTSFYNFYLAYSKKKNKFLYYVYAICILEIIYLWFFSDLKTGTYTLPNVGLIFRGMPPFSYILIFGAIKYIVLIMATTISFLYEFVKETNSLNKRQFKWLTVGFFVLIFGFFEWAPAFNIPLHIAWLPLLIFIGLLAYAILNYQLMDINIIIKKGLIYSVIIALISGFLVGASLLSSWLTSAIPGFQLWIVPLFVGIVTFFIGNIFWRQSKKVEKAYEVEKKAYEELKKLDAAKDEFILITQHHLRTPLTIMKGYHAAILSKFKDKADSQGIEYTEKASASTDRLAVIVNEFLDITQFQIGKGLLKIEEVNLYNMTKEIFDELQPELAKKKLFIKINPEPQDWPLIKADKEKLKQALFNIIDNAIKYTPEGGITISLKKQEGLPAQAGKVLLTIADTGIGLSPEDLKKLFTEVFERSEEAKKVFPTGRGVGLFVTASIIKAHQGKIWAESEGLQKGSTFFIELGAH